MKILVTGSREWDNEALLWDVLDAFHKAHGVRWLVVGDCPTGADAMATEWARDRGHPIALHVFVADWANEGKAAGPNRNRRMVEVGKPDVCFAFLKEGAGNRGTRHCASVAREHGVPTAEWYG